MNLLVDAGNSCLKWALLEDNALHPGGRLLRGKKTAKALLAEAWDEMEATPQQVLVSNVAGDTFRRSLTAYCKRRWGVKPEYFSSEPQQCGVTNGYANPAELGVDRWLAILGARSIKQAPCCIIDCGTALTVDVLDQDGQHLGGLIMPGMHLMRQSLVDAASGIKETPHLSDSRPKHMLAADTGNGIIVGTLYTAIAAIDRIVADIRAELGGALQCYITGGEARLFLPLIDQRIRHEPELVFKGMQAILNGNQTSQPDKPAKKKKRPSRKAKARKEKQKVAEDKPGEQEPSGEKETTSQETTAQDNQSTSAESTAAETEVKEQAL